MLALQSIERSAEQIARTFHLDKQLVREALLEARLVVIDDLVDVVLFAGTAKQKHDIDEIRIRLEALFPIE